MATQHNISDDKVVKLLKSKPGESMQFYANQLGIPLGAVGGFVYRLESEADPKLQIKTTTDKQVSDAVVRLRNKENLRWERIGHRLRPALSAAKVKAVYEAATGTSATESYTGRGRQFGTSTAGRKTSTAAAGRSASKKTTAAGRGTSGRRAAAKTKTATAGRSATKKATTAAGRSAARKDPS